MWWLFNSGYTRKDVGSIMAHVKVQHILTFAWKNWSKLQSTSFRIAGLQAQTEAWKLHKWSIVHCDAVAYQGWGGGVKPLLKLRRPSKIVPNSTRLWKLLKIDEFRMPTHQDVWKKGSKILKLPPVHNCFTLPMANKLVVIMNSLKVPKINKILLYEMKFLAPNYSCLQNPWLGATTPRSPFSLSSVLNWICWTPPPPPNKIPGYATAVMSFMCR